MNCRFVFRPAAQREFDEAAHWYEVRQPGLGAEYVEEVQKTLDLIATEPKRYPIVVADVREAPVRRFPFCVYYRIKADRLVVIAVFHSARNPETWQSRV